MSNPLSDFRQLSTQEMDSKLKELASAIEGNVDPELEGFALGLIAHLIQCTGRVFTYQEKMEKVIAGLPQSFEAKESLLAEIAEYPLATPNEKRDIRNRIQAALVARPAPAEKPKKHKSFEVNGRSWDLPEGF